MDSREKMRYLLFNRNRDTTWCVMRYLTGKKLAQCRNRPPSPLCARLPPATLRLL